MLQCVVVVFFEGSTDLNVHCLQVEKSLQAFHLSVSNRDSMNLEKERETNQANLLTN